MNDDELVELLEAGHRYALALCHDPARAGDLVQDAWLAVIAAGQARPSKAYFFRAVRSRWIDFLRSAAVRRTEAAPEPEPAVSATHEQALLADDVASALGNLRPAEREAIVLTLVEGYSAAAAGRLLGKSRNTVLSRVYRAKAKMRNHLLAWWQEEAS